MLELTMLTFERRQLRRERGSLFTGPENFIDRPIQRILREQVRQYDAGLLANHGKEMAEFVGQTARDPADRLHFLSLGELPFQPLALRFLLFDKRVRLPEILFQSLDANFQLLARTLERVLRLPELFNVMEQLYFLLPLGSDRFQGHAVEHRHHEEHRHTQEMSDRERAGLNGPLVEHDTVPCAE